MKTKNPFLSLLMVLAMLLGMLAMTAAGPAEEGQDDPAEEITAAGLALTLPQAGPTGAAAGEPVPAAASVASGTGFAVQNAHWLTAAGATPESFAPGEAYYAELDLVPGEGYCFTADTAVSIDTLAVMQTALTESGALHVITANFTLPAADRAYPLWLGNTQVTDANRLDILGDGCAQFDPESGTLTLNDPKIFTLRDPSFALIEADGIDLILTGTVTLDTEGADIGVLVADKGNLILDKLELNAKVRDSGIYVDSGKLRAKDSKVTVESQNNYAIYVDGDITVTGEKSQVSGKSTKSGYGVASNSQITVEGGSLEGRGMNSGIQAGGGITMAGTHGVVLPAGGKLSDNGKTVCDSEGNTAAQAKIAPLDAVYTVSFDTYGGPEVESQTVVTGGTAQEPDEPVLEGFQFGGWFLDPAKDEENPYDFSTPVTGDLSLKAYWTAEVSAGVKDIDGKTGTGGTVSLGGGTYSDSLSAKVWRDSGKAYQVSCKPAEGYTFDHWEDGSGNKLSETGTSISFSAKDGAKSFVAVFKPGTFTVTFDVGEDGSPVPAQSVPYGGKAYEPDDDPTRKGYTFDCWCADKDGKIVFDFNTPITKNTTIYAKWNQIAKYTVVSGGGSIYGRASGKELQLVVKRNPKDAECFKHFTSVEIDGGTLIRDTDYTAESGSTIINLKPSVLGKLNSGRHVITINFDDGKATTGLTVKAGKSGGRSGGKGDKSPDTGDTNPLLWTGLLTFSCIGLGGVLLTGRRARRARR